MIRIGITFITGNLALLLFRVLFTIMAIGDYMIINVLKSEDKNSYVLDHPSEAGSYVYRQKLND